jgi:hypothetical protein
LAVFKEKASQADIEERLNIIIGFLGKNRRDVKKGGLS